MEVGARTDVGWVVGHVDGCIRSVGEGIAGLLELLALFGLFLGVVVFFGLGDAEFEEGNDKEGHFVEGWEWNSWICCFSVLFKLENKRRCVEGG